MTPHFELDIDALNLEGYTRQEGRVIIAHMEREFTRLISLDTQHHQTWQRNKTASLDRVVLPTGSSPRVVGRQLAQGIYKQVVRSNRK